MAERGKSRPGAPPLPPEEARLFEAAMRDIRRRKRGTATQEAAPAPAPPVGPVAPTPHRAPPAPGRDKALPPLDAGAAVEADRRTMDRLRRGRLRPEARVDLHGMTLAEAHGALDRFIAGARAAERRCVLVVTGKGSVTAGGGAIRNAVPGWLNAPALRPSIVAFTHAAPRDGGAGALYVLLRRGGRPRVGGP